MSEAIAFDTHRFVKHLTENGFTEQQAEVLADEQVHLLNTNLATQADIATVHQDIEILRQETKANLAEIRRDIAEVKADLIKWMVGALIAQGGVIVALLKLLPG